MIKISLTARQPKNHQTAKSKTETMALPSVPRSPRAEFQPEAEAGKRGLLRGSRSSPAQAVGCWEFVSRLAGEKRPKGLT